MASTRLFGLEAELAVGATQASQALPTHRLVETMHQIARRTLVHLPGEGSRLYLVNGGLFYVDCGMHPEIATAECTSPDEAVCHLRAGERLVADLARQAGTELKADSVLVARSNVDYLEGTTWGCHESYLGVRPVDHYAPWLIPHLTSRIVFTGSGGLDPLSPGIRLSLSPRVAHIDRALSPNSTSDRGIFHTRDEPLCKGYSRVHVLAGDNACSQRSTWLKIGTTALVVALAETEPPGSTHLKLVDPVAAMHGFARDLHHRVPVRIGGGKTVVPMSATEIQREILRKVEAMIGTRAVPHWADEVCIGWRAALDLVESSAIEGSHVFDWPLKFALLRREMARRGFAQARLDAWSDALEHLARGSGDCADEWPVTTSPTQIDARRREGGFARADVAAADRVLARHGLVWKDLDEFDRLRRQLFEIDVRFGVLGSGLFELLDSQGLIEQHRVVTSAQVEAAATQPPLGSRAAERSHWIKKLAGRGSRYLCDWSFIHGEQGRIDLGNPFAAPSQDTNAAGARPGAAWHRVQERLATWMSGAE